MTKAVLITGASRGIGFETAKLLAGSKNAVSTLALVARDTAKFDAALAELRSISNGCQIVGIRADLSDPSVVDTIYQQLDQNGIRLSTIINNAGFTKPASINETEMDDFETTMRTNLYSPFRIIQLALRKNHPLEQIVNIASTAGMNGRAGWLTYSASKSAMINMSEVLRSELAPYGIDVICLSPGRCATDLRKTLAPEEDPETIMQPKQVAEIIKLMISETGQLLHSQNLVVRT